MNTKYAIERLLDYAEDKGLIEKMERRWALNTILDALKLPSVDAAAADGSAADTCAADGSADNTAAVTYGDADSSAADTCGGEGGKEVLLQEVLDALLDNAHKRGVLTEDTVTYRDLLDTEIMGRITPRPAQVAEKFRRLYDESPEAATDWYYRFSQDTNYIRRDRMVRDIRWKAATEYGDLDITINLSKPEKDPKAIAAARELPASNYPRCLLCAENEGYAGRPDHPARQNHRLIPITLDGKDWFLQYSPYTYYNEHCIVLSGEHAPMKIDESCFRKLLEFVGKFPHYFVGSNADLPIVGGSILAHEHFQGGRYKFAMEKAPVETKVEFQGFSDIDAGIVKWPMSVIRIASADRDRLIELAVKILDAWRGYSDEAAGIYAETAIKTLTAGEASAIDTSAINKSAIDKSAFDKSAIKEPHNTITPIARMRDGKFELDLVLRNNITTPEHPLGVFHPHAELHHIKKENIGLIEVMGLAVLPGRLKEELSLVAEGLASGADLRKDPRTEKHADWAEEIRVKYGISTTGSNTITGTVNPSSGEQGFDGVKVTMDGAPLDSDAAWAIVQEETGLVFSKVLEHAGVYKRTPDGKAAFLRFIASVK